MDNYKLFCELYVYFRKKVEDNNLYKFYPTEKQVKIIKKFLEKNKEIITNDYLFDFLLFQFSKYENSKNFYPQISWVVGNKAEVSYKKRTDAQLFYVNLFKKKYKIRNKFKIKSNLKLSKEYFDNLRKRNSKLEFGFFNCLEINLFESYNIICKNCKNYKICKNLKK